MIFKENWPLLGLTQEFPRSGFLERSIAGLSLALGKTHKNNYKCYTNICRHRGGPLLWKDERKRGSGLSCRYHGWSYNAETGKLFKTPHFGNIDCSPLSLEAWQIKIIHESLIFVCHTPNPKQLPKLKTFQNLLTNQTIPLNISAQRRHILKCNWKIYVENYLEGLHIPYLHPKLRSEIDMNTYHVKVHEHHITHHVGASEDAVSAGLWVYLWPNLALNFYQDVLSKE